jgi:hypothetical protein
MRSVNRSAVIVRPAQPFLDWLHEADPTSAELTLEDLRRDPSVYLLPVYDAEEQARSHLRKRCEEIFEEQLEGWYRDPSAWPVKRDFGTFIRWFDWQFYSGLFDVCPKAAIYDEDY